MGPCSTTTMEKIEKKYEDFYPSSEVLNKHLSLSANLEAEDYLLPDSKSFTSDITSSVIQKRSFPVKMFSPQKRCNFKSGSVTLQKNHDAIVSNDNKASEKENIVKACDGIFLPYEHFVIWPNRDSLCWLNSAFAFLLHSYNIRRFMESSIPGDCEVKNLYNCYKTVLDIVNNQSTTDVTFARIYQELRSMQDHTFNFLQEKMRCVKGKPDSPVFAIPLLLEEHCFVKKMFQVKHWWSLDCEKCFAKCVYQSDKIVVSFHKITEDFSLTSPVSLGVCNKCFAKDQKRKLNFDKLPQSLIFHFINGYTKGDLLNSDFEFQGQKYALKGCIFYVKVFGQRHFVTWIRDVKTNKWMNCDDLQPGFHRFSSAVPKFSPGEVHVVMWERISTTTAENVQQICDDLKEDFCDVSFSASTSLYARNNVIQKELHETFKGLDVKTASSKRRKLNYFEASEGHTEFDSSVSDASQSSDVSEPPRNNDFFMISSKAFGRTLAKEDEESEDIPDIVFPTPIIVKKCKRRFIDKYHADHYSTGGGSSYSSSFVEKIMAQEKTDRKHSAKKESIGKTSVEREASDKMSSTEFLESNIRGFEELKYFGDGSPKNVCPSLVTGVSESTNYLNDTNIFARDTVTPSGLRVPYETVQLVNSATVKCFEKEQPEKQLYFKQRSCYTSSENQNISEQTTTRSTQNIDRKKSVVPSERVTENHICSDSSSDHDASLFQYASEPTKSNALTETSTNAFKGTFASDAEKVKEEMKKLEKKTCTNPDIKLQSFQTPFSSFSFPKISQFSTKTNETSSSAIETEKLQRSEVLKMMLKNIFARASSRSSVSKEINASQPISVTVNEKKDQNEKKERISETSLEDEGADCIPCIKFAESDRTKIMRFKDSGLLEGTTADDVKNIKEEDKRKKCVYPDVKPQSFERPFHSFSARPWFSMETDGPSKNPIEELQRSNNLKMMLNNIFAAAASRLSASKKINSSHPVAASVEGVENKQSDEKAECSSESMVKSKVAKRKFEWKRETEQKACKNSRFEQLRTERPRSEIDPVYHVESTIQTESSFDTLNGEPKSFKSALSLWESKVRGSERTEVNGNKELKGDNISSNQFYKCVNEKVIKNVNAKNKATESTWKGKSHMLKKLVPYSMKQAESNLQVNTKGESLIDVNQEVKKNVVETSDERSAALYNLQRKQKVSSMGNMKQMSLEDLQNGINTSSNKWLSSTLEMEETAENEHSKDLESSIGSAVDGIHAGTDFPKSLTIQIPNDTLQEKYRMLGIKQYPKNEMIDNMFLLKPSRTPDRTIDIAYQPVVLVKKLDSDTIKDICEKLKNKRRSKKARKSCSAESSERRNQKLAKSRSKSEGRSISGKTIRDSSMSQKKSKSTVKQEAEEKSNSESSKTRKAKINLSCGMASDKLQMVKSRKSYSETLHLYKSTKAYSKMQGFKAIPSYSLGISECRPKDGDKLEVERSKQLWTDDNSSTNHIDKCMSERAVESAKAEEKCSRRTQKWENETPKKLVFNSVEQVESSPEINTEKKLPAVNVVKKQKVYLHIHTYRLARLKDLENMHTD